MLVKMQILKRGVILFMFGMFFSLVLNLLQTYREIREDETPPGLFDHYSSCWWVLPVCGLTAAFVGLMYPVLDSHLEEPLNVKSEWSNVMRCVAVFVGINHASAKLDFMNNLHMSLTLAAMCIGLWWLFDRSKSGFGLGVGIAVLATILTQFLVYQGIYKYGKADFMFMRSWLPCIFFSGGITIGNIGRQLALYDDKEKKD
ncbi:INSI2-like protein [Mya arenaria]|uniref:INSI2-like protein n=1 Tax=Mya arenaria TaxID=6604 RepID=A0ABY7D760_MYAAR|nr:insulin-induced gene 2 protein-like [Mya arenaria]WAQ93511.1 INSI2-like protein [Mya arenaria]